MPMKILSLITFLFAMFLNGGIIIGRLKYPMLGIEYYFELPKLFLYFLSALAFCGIFYYLSPIFDRRELFIKFFRLFTAIYSTILTIIFSFVLFSNSSPLENLKTGYLVLGTVNCLAMVTSLFIYLSCKRKGKKDVN